ncbi:hypothetical protein L6261_02360 [Candidatus Parcubacteria bacterium]|nr:hypothetical protein [Candidatus Parcubacteria bacterium]
MTPFFSFLKNFVFQKTKKWCHARKDELPKAVRPTDFSEAKIHLLGIRCGGLEFSV